MTAKGLSCDVVDFSSILSDSTDLSTCPQVKEIHSAFSTVGFVFLKNHGIERKLIDKAFESVTQFFGQSAAAKLEHLKGGFGPDGYTSIGPNNFNSPQPDDLKEFYDICDPNIPDIPESFSSVKSLLYNSCTALSMRLLEVLGHTLKLKDPDFFVKTHGKIGQGFIDNYSLIRLINYPPLPVDLEAGRERCVEHVDYGTFSFLFQDSSGGLQVKCCNGHYVDVPYMEDSVLVILGRTLGLWTSNLYPPTFHRVPIPVELQKQQMCRKSIAFFVHPDSDVCIEPLDAQADESPCTTETTVSSWPIINYCTTL